MFGHFRKLITEFSASDHGAAGCEDQLEDHLARLSDHHIRDIGLDPKEVFRPVPPLPFLR